MIPTVALLAHGKASGTERSMTFRSTNAIQMTDAAVRIAKQGCASHYHPSVLADVWRRATREQWARLALLAAIDPPNPPDASLRGEVLDEMESRCSSFPASR
jgi:hypothetical protein